MNSTKCPSCGIDYTDHAGLTGTCRELRKALARIDDMRFAVREYVGDSAKRLADDDDAPEDMRAAARRMVAVFGKFANADAIEEDK
jgi:hypothetical protein